MLDKTNLAEAIATLAESYLTTIFPQLSAPPSHMYIYILI